MLTPEVLPRLQQAIADAGLDGWLLFDFRGINAIAHGLLGFEATVSRRYFVFVPREGAPVAITHAIEQDPWAGWPAGWHKEIYSSWRALEGMLADTVAGKRIAMEYSPGDAVPYLDRVPAGVLEMVRATGATVVSSGELVSQFHATWTPEHLAAHARAAERIAAIAQEAFAHAGAELAAGRRVTERDLQVRMLEAFGRENLITDSGPNVSAQENAANPHYEPTAEAFREIRRGEVVLIDLWAHEPGVVPYADQTWMAIMGAPDDEMVRVWEAVRDGRDAAIRLIRERLEAGTPVRGADADDVTRRVIESRGFGERFIHRTGHSIDAREIHGSGPHLDNLESREERLLRPGVGFSIEPGVYFPGRFGMRSEVNAIVGDRELVVTPSVYQQDLIVFA